MADGTELNLGVGGDVIDTDDLGGGLKIQVVKVAFGAGGARTYVEAGAPLPTQGNVVDHSAFTESATYITPVGYIFDETAGTALTENDCAAARIDAKRAQVFVIEDESTRGRRAAVKAASTAAAAADPALVVAISPNTSNLTLTVQGSVADNAAFTDGTTRVVPVGYIFDETAGTALTENDVGAARMDSKRAQVFVIEDATTRGRRATVLAASTSAAATDIALVVALSPNVANLTLTVQGTLADNAGFTDGTTRVFPSGFIFDETAGTALTENDVAAARIDSKRAIVMVLEDETTRGRRLTITAANAAKVDGSAVTQPISAASLPLPAGAATETTLSAMNISLVDNAAFTDGTSRVSAPGYIYDEAAGTALTENDIAAARIDSKRAQVFVIEDETTRGRRLAITSRLAAMVEGSVAHDAADAGNSIKIGARYVSSLVAVSAANDRTDLVSDRFSRQLTVPVDVGFMKTKSATYTSQQTGTNFITPTSGKRIVVTSLTISTDSTTAGKITIWSAASGTTSYTEGTHQCFEAAYFRPSATVSPGLKAPYYAPVCTLAVDDCLKATSSAAMTFVLTVQYYEVDA